MKAEEPVKDPGQLQCDLCSRPLPAFFDGGHSVVCENCGKYHHFRAKSAQATVMFALTALIFYLPANIFPFMTMELYGNRNSSTIWGGVVSLATAGSWFLATIVFLASIVIPLIKLLVLFYLSLSAGQNGQRRLKTRLYHFVEAIGRWSMLDIFLLAILVAIMKLGHWTSVEPEVGSVLFAFVVIFTLLASASFDPRLIWEKSGEPSHG